MSTTTLTALRPKSGSVQAVRDAIAAAAAERQQAEQRLVDLRRARTAALLDPSATSKRIAGLEVEAHEVENRLERLTLLMPALQEKLAVARQTAQQNEIDRQVTAAEAAIKAFADAARDYPDLAQRIAEICRLDHAAHAAILEAQRQANAVGQTVSFPYLAFNGGRLANQVVLPSQNGMHWGRGLAPQSVYATERVLG